MVNTSAETLMDADSVCEAELRRERTTKRNDYRPPARGTWAARIELAVSKLRAGGYVPSWLLLQLQQACGGGADQLGASCHLHALVLKVREARHTVRSARF